MDAASLKSETQTKLTGALADDFRAVNNEIQAVETEIINSTSAIHSDKKGIKREVLN